MLGGGGGGQGNTGSLASVSALAILAAREGTPEEHCVPPQSL